MTGGFILQILSGLTIPVLYGALCLVLLGVIGTDLRSRTISNALTASVAGLAPLLWLAQGLALWPDILIRIAIALACFAFFAAIYARGGMGGGDVKLIAAVALSLPPALVVQFLLVMSLAGGILSFILWFWSKFRPPERPIDVPYGVAIAFGAFWSVAAII